MAVMSRRSRLWCLCVCVFSFHFIVSVAMGVGRRALSARSITGVARGTCSASQRPENYEPSARVEIRNNKCAPRWNGVRNKAEQSDRSYVKDHCSGGRFGFLRNHWSVSLDWHLSLFSSFFFVRYVVHTRVLSSLYKVIQCTEAHVIMQILSLERTD